MRYMARQPDGRPRPCEVPDSYVYEQGEAGLSAQEACEKFVASADLSRGRAARLPRETGRDMAVRVLGDCAARELGCAVRPLGKGGFAFELGGEPYEVRVVKKQAKQC